MLALPQEILLHILSFLDIPDLAALSHVSKQLALLTADPVLHRTRLKVVAPSRVQHSLFGRSPEGILLRPTIPELIHRGVMRGLQIERRLRTGDYLYSPHASITEFSFQLPCHIHAPPQAAAQYELSLRIRQTHTKVLLSSYLRTRLSPPIALKLLHYSHVLPDVESLMLSISRSLLPMVHKLKWSIQKDNMSRVVRSHTFSAMHSESPHPFNGGFGTWVELKGANIFGDSERVRLALCPDVRKMIQFYEKMA
ncbi:hypothetical protein JVT61DRAFT_5308 [Boletus reticuloceps]|uniref:F-box domain-containing protein n=1 Tax=Boletus reticuloceps TaxID=495285 RepID=A0A8I3AFY2_9AGAM|nr:hypothetical protein JVT61DRAFT_5308 [Boletus reticuloceps]